MKNYFYAKNSRELGIYLKGLYVRDIDFMVFIEEDAKCKITYAIQVDVSEEEFKALMREFKILIQR